MLKKFKVESYNVLAAGDLKDAINQMRQVDGSEWKDMDDPISALKALREKGNGLH